MIAAVLALCALSLGLTTFVLLCGKWLHDANDELGRLRDTLTANDAVSDAYRYERDEAVVERDVAKEQHRVEHNLRTIAEQQRNEAQRKTRDILRKHMRTATDEEIRETVAELFASPLAVVPRAPSEPGRVQPQGPRRSDAGPDALLDPFAKV